VENFHPEENLAVVKFHRVPGQWLPVWKLARLLNVCRAVVLEWIEEGAIKIAFDLRGKGSSRSTIRIPRSVVVEFAALHETGNVIETHEHAGDFRHASTLSEVTHDNHVVIAFHAHIESMAVTCDSDR
jgi:hypothetical protein